MAPGGLSNQLVEESSPGDPASGADFNSDLMGTCDIKWQSNPSGQTDQIAGAGQRVQVSTSPPGVSNCYVFKSLLQEYAQKVGLPTPVYVTIKEGPSHQPSFKSTVILGGVRYDSLLGFLNRKAAEQSAAEIALMELSKCGESKESTFVPVHETGLCKNLLQDYTQKMNYALPTYTCKRDDTPGKTLPFSCSVEIGGIRYIGAAAKTKKEAEIKAARTALLAIRSSNSAGSENPSMKSQYTVVPPKRKVPDTAPSQATEKPKKKPKRPRLKKRQQIRRHPANAGEQIQLENVDVLAVNDDTQTLVAVQQIQNGLSDDQAPDHRQTTHSLASSAQDFPESSINQDNSETSVMDGASVPTAAYLQQGDGNVNSLVSLAPPADANREPNDVSIIKDFPPSHQMDASVSDSGICQGKSDANREPSVADVASIITHLPALHQVDESDPGISQGEPDANREPNVPDVASIVTDPFPMDESVSDPGVSQGQRAPILPDTASHRREENTAAVNVAPVMSDPPPTQELQSLVSEIGQAEPAPTMAD